MASNSKNIAELLNGDTTLTATDIANDAVTADKLANSINTDIATGVAALPKSGGAMTGAITSNNTISDVGGNVRSGRKNLIINGGMNVKQRGDSHSTEGYGSLDRYSMGLSGASATMSQEDLTLGQSDIPSRFRHYMKLNCTTGNNNCGLYHHIENPSELEGAYILSFYAKGTNPAAGNFALSVQSSYGTGGSGGVNPHDGTLTVTSSWQRFTVAVTFPSLTGKTINDADGSTAINIRQGGSDTGTAAWALDITGLQLELGSVATDFEHRSYGEELALCQRYYYKDIFNVSILPWASSGGGFGGQTFLHNPEMRAAPTITQLAVPSYSNILGGAGPQSQNTYSTSVNVNTSGNEKSFKLQNNVSGNTIYAVSSQLAFSAEL